MLNGSKRNLELNMCFINCQGMTRYRWRSVSPPSGPRSGSFYVIMVGAGESRRH